jgi:hypothetical protein
MRLLRRDGSAVRGSAKIGRVPLPATRHAEQDSVQASWRQEHGAANARGPGASAQSALEARLLFGGGQSSARRRAHAREGSAAFH